MSITKGSCQIEIGSITQTMKVQRILAEAAIPTTVIKKETSGKANKGCSYGLSFSCAQINNVRTVLDRERIRVSEWKIGS